MKSRVTRGDKRLIFIVSGGRTGTKFFAIQLGRLLENTFAVHEPDALDTDLGAALRKVRRFGFRHMVFDRLLGKSGIRQLSEAFLCGEISKTDAIRKMQQSRYSYYASIPNAAIVESYYAWYGLVPLLADAFENVRVLVVTRDPRDWVRSQMNWGTQFGPRDWASKIGFKKLNPARLGESEFVTEWDDMDRFSRLCWLWRIIYTALRDASGLPFVHVEKFENLFFGEGNILRMKTVLQFLYEGTGDLPNIEAKFVQKRIHANVSYSFPKWPEWTSAQAMQLDAICGPVMKELGYGGELAWRRLIAQ